MTKLIHNKIDTPTDTLQQIVMKMKADSKAQLQQKHDLEAAAMFSNGADTECLMNTFPEELDDVWQQ